MITTLQISSIQLFHNQLTSMFVCAFVDSYILVCLSVCVCVCVVFYAEVCVLQSPESIGLYTPGVTS